MNDDTHTATPPPDRTPPRGARSMNVVRWALFAGLLALAVVSIGSYVIARRGPAAGDHVHARYYCPMHPSYTSDRPGECPICGMTLEPIPSGGVPTDSGATGNVPGLVPIHLTPDRVQMIGVRTAVAERRALSGDLELPALVAPDEGAMRRIQLQVGGQVQQLMVNRVGQRIEVGEPLLSLYSPEIFQTEQELLIERGPADTAAVDAHGMGGPSAARERLRLLGVPLEEIRRLERERIALPVVMFNARVGGTVIERLVTEGQRIEAGTPLFTVADLSRVWVVADLYQMDMGRVRAGERALFLADGLPGHGRAGSVEFVYPTMSAGTRTQQIRVALDNGDGALKPGMFGRVRLAGRGGAVVAVPAEAVVSTGEGEYVFITHGGGTFEPRAVSTGARGDGFVQVLAGLAEGDTVVASAAFLIDSESRLKAAISGMGPQRGPNARPAPGAGAHQGH